ncbi:MAG: RecX family transcriptional regulator [Prevotella sp.]|nr:RecX family transcriptional regulator [Prevotella sp.]
MALNRGERKEESGERLEQMAFQKLSALCARGEHCQHDMLEKMRQWGVDEEAQARVMARLVGERYVDDERYARAFVHDKLAYNQWGRRKIEQALWMKHVDGETVRTVLDEIDENEYVSVLQPLLKQKRKSVTGRNDYERNLKLMKWAVGRGFTMDVIRQCIAVELDNDE